MAIIKPFRAIRPTKEFVSKVAAPPYDIVTAKEARQLVKNNEHSFLYINRPEIAFEEFTDPYDFKVYAKAREKLLNMIDEKVFIQDKSPWLYIYQLSSKNLIQKGIVTCTSIDDYQNNVIKKHEHTLPIKEPDRADHINYVGAHTGPVLMTYRENPKITQITDDWISNHIPVYDFYSNDGVGQAVWVVDNKIIIKEIVDLFAQVKALYIADGHHRAAAATKVGMAKRAKNPNYSGDEGYNHFLSVIFPDTQLAILEYNRVIKDLNGLSKDELVKKIKENFEFVYEGRSAYKPQEKHFFGMYLNEKWYGLKAKPHSFNGKNPIKSLDVSILHDLIIVPVLNITDPRVDNRIDFVGGVKGLRELERRVDSGEMKIAFSLFPTPLDDLMCIADSNSIMPPKSTWFEPKLLSGIFIHQL